MDDRAEWREALLSSPATSTVVCQEGNFTVSLQITPTGVWIGQHVKPDLGAGYFTTRSVKVQYSELSQIKKIYDELLTLPLDSSQKVSLILPLSDVVMIRDIYKGKSYISLRRVYYYAKELYPTRNGFNLDPFQFKKFIDNIQRLIQ